MDQIIEKSDFFAEKNAKLREAFGKSMPRKARENYEKILEDPSNSGLDLSNPIYYFIELKEDYYGIISKVSDKEKLEQCLRANTSEIESEYSINDYKVMDLGYALYIYNDNSYLYISLFNYYYDWIDREDEKKELVKKLTSLDKDSSFTSLEAYNHLEKDKDIALALNLTSLLNENKFQPIIGKIFDANKQLPKSGVYYMLSLNSELGALRIDGEIFSQDEAFAKKLDQQYKEQLYSLDGKFLKSISKDALLTLAIGLNGEIYSKEIKQIISDDLLKDAKEEDVPVSMIFDALASINGDCVFSIKDLLPQNEDDIALCKLKTFIQLKDSKAMEELLKAIHKNSDDEVTDLGNNRYSIKVDEEIPTIYYGIEDNVFYITTKDLPLAELRKETSDNILSLEPYKELDNEDALLFVNFAPLKLQFKPQIEAFLNAESKEAIDKLEYYSMTHEKEELKFESTLKFSTEEHFYAILLDVIRSYTVK